MKSFDRHAWAEPSPERIDDGTIRLPLPMPNDGLRAVNCYAVHAGDDLVLIDPGWATEEATVELRRQLSSFDLDLTDVTGIAVTHAHRDHYSNAVRLRDLRHVPIMLGEHERVSLQTLMEGSGRSILSQHPRLALAGAAEVVTALATLGTSHPDAYASEEYAEPDVWLADGDTINVGSRRLRAMHTPGHTRGHLVFVDDDQALAFTGDHVLPTITPSAGFEPALTPHPLTDYRASLLMSTQGPARLLLPAHGPAEGDVRHRADELLRHHATREQELLSVATAGETTAYQLAQRLRWTRREVPFTELATFNQALAVIETLFHADALVDRDELQAIDEGGIRRYTRADAALSAG
jgi:glyoxylase-like metal-dependent hydrolase (beta-lactamase superfamily II)